MASFLKVGERIVNLDAVASIDLDAELYGTAKVPDGRVLTGHVVPGVIVHLMNDYEMHFKGDDAATFRAWVESVAIDAAGAVSARRRAVAGTGMDFDG